MLSNAYFLAKFRFDTAENEPAKNLQKFASTGFLTSSPGPGDLHPHDPRPRGAGERREPRGGRPHRDLRQQQLLQHPERLRDADHGDGGGQVRLRRLS